MISNDIHPMDKLIEKYDRPGPRYTSFPALPFWKNDLDEDQWVEHIRESLLIEPAIDLYIHIPFCQKLCWYCGCNRIITKDQQRSNEYIQALKNEWSFYLHHFPNIEIKSIHFGGGTPTFLPAEQLNELLSIFSNHIDPEFIGSIEIDPRTVDRDQLHVLKRLGFKRASLGIQDFEEEVQIAINRIQSYSLVEGVVKMLKDTGFESINFDLIFGLPKQTVKSINDTIEKVSNLDPDLLAFYSYAHLPERIANQKLINEEFLPVGKDKRELYEKGKAALFKAGYFEVGMDHFAKSESYLYKAFDNKKLHRSFMGYTDTKSSTLIGLGATSISNTRTSFRQNEKDVKSYVDQMAQTALPVNQTSHVLSSSDQVTNDIIQSLMCNLQADITLLREVEMWSFIESGLNEFEKDKLLRIDDDMLYITEIGRIFLRNICMVLDPYLGEKGALRFSQTV